MKHCHQWFVVAVAGLSLVGCYTPEGQPDRTASGALLGGALGAGTGAIIGNYAGHNTAGGAAIGGALGALTGAIVGNAMDQQQRETLARQSPATLQRVEQGQPLGVADIKALAKAGVSDEVIISQIRASRMVYHFSTAEIIDMKDAGVSERVIEYMINTPNTVGSATPPPNAEVVTSAPPPPAPIVEEVVVAPGPDYVWIDGSWIWVSGRWVWGRGYWALPPYWHAMWVRGGWVRGRRGYVWMGGHWH
jgi:uncharacterized protein YcfJ